MSQTRREELAGELTREAALAYTAGSQRRVLDTAAWLLREFRTEDELATWLAEHVVSEMLPKNRAAVMRACS